MTRGGKEDKKKNPDTPESSTTQSSQPSVDDEVAQLLPRGASSSGRQSRSRSKKQKPVTSESSTTPSSAQSVDDQDAPLLQRSARPSSSKSPSKSTQAAQKVVAQTRSSSSRRATSSSNAPESTPEKSRLSIPDQGAKGPKSPSKSPSTLSQLKKSLATRFSPKKKSPKRSIDPKSPRTRTTDYTELNPEADAKRKSPKRNDSKESSSQVSGVILKEGVKNTQPLTVSDSCDKVSSDDAPQSENRLNVPEPEKITSSPKSPKKSFLAQMKLKFSPKSPERRKDEVHSKDASPKSSIKSESSSSSASPISKKRQESSTSNISSENSRSSNSKSSSTSCASNKESLRPDVRRQFLECSSNNQIRNDSYEGSSSDSAEHTRNGRQLSTDDYFKIVHDSFTGIQFASKDPYEGQASGLEIEPVTERLDNLYFEEEGMNQRESKQRKRARSFFSNIFIRHRKQTPSKVGSKSRQEDGIDHETQSGAAVACSDHLVGRKSPRIESDDKTDVDTKDDAASWSDPSVRRKEITTRRGVDDPHDVEASGLDQSVRRKETRRGDNAPHGVEASALDQSVRRKETRRGDNAPHGVEASGLDQSVRRKKTRRGDIDPHGEEARWEAPRSSRLFQRDLAARPCPSVTRHHSLSPKCEHRYIYPPGCSKIRRIRERRNQRKCKQPKKNINTTVEEIGSERQAVRRHLRSLRSVQEKLSRLEEEVFIIVCYVEGAVNECSSRAEEVAEHSLRAEIEKYSSRLKKIKADLLELLEKIREIIGNLDLPRLEAIRENFLRRENEVEEILNNMDENRLEVHGSNFSRLEVARGNFSSIVEELEEIQNNARFSILESVSENLSRMEDEVVEILTNRNLQLHLSRLQQDIQDIFKKINESK